MWGSSSFDVSVEMQRRIDELQVKLAQVENAFQKSFFFWKIYVTVMTQ